MQFKTLFHFLTFFVEKVAAVRSSFHFGAWLSTTLPLSLRPEVLRTELFLLLWTWPPCISSTGPSAKRSFEWSKQPRSIGSHPWVKRTLYWSLILALRLFIAAAPKRWNLSPCGLLTVLLTSELRTHLFKLSFVWTSTFCISRSLF